MTILLLEGRMKSVWNKLFRTSFIKPDDNKSTLEIMLFSFNYFPFKMFEGMPHWISFSPLILSFGLQMCVSVKP
jgi:hypothetical protein